MNGFKENINKATLLYIITLLLGVASLILLLSHKPAYGFLLMMIGFIVWPVSLALKEEGINNFNIGLEKISNITLFGLTSVIYGIVEFENKAIILAVIILYFINISLNEARNWESKPREFRGWPLFINGIIFPLFYYGTRIFLAEHETSVLILLYLGISILALTPARLIK